MSTDDSSPIHQARNSIFQRLNKLANTKLLKSFISGQQLIDLNNLEIKTHNNEGLKSKKMVKILEDKAHQAVDTIKMKNIRFNDNPKGEITKKLLTEAELPKKSFLKPLGSLQVNSNSEILNQVSENKPSILRSIDSFEIEGPSLDLTTNKQSHQNIEDIEDTFPNLEIEQMYDIRKISLRKISNRSESPIGEVGYHKEKQKISSLGANEKKDEKKDKVLRKGFSYSDFELGGDNKRKITFDRRFEQQKNGKRICNRIKKRIREIMDISKLKLKLENSFVDVVITSGNNREIDVVLQRKKIILLPVSFMKMLIDLFLSIICLYFLFSTPVFIAFLEGDYLSAQFISIECAFCFLFFIDIWLSFRTGYINRRGVLELYPSKITYLYLKTNFFFDLISTFPIVTLFPDNPYMRLIYLLRLFKIARLYQILARSLEFSSIHPGFVRIIKSFIVLIILCHNIACFYWYISLIEGFNTSEWVPSTHILNQSGFEQYVFSLFFAITVTMGVGINIVPCTLLETIYSFFSIIIGVFMYGLLLGSATSALMSLDEEDADIRKQLDSLNMFMRKKKVTLELQKRIQENLKYLWSSNQSLNITNQWFLKGVHPLLKLELMLEINKKYLEKVPLFKNLNFEGIINLISLLEIRIYLPDEFILYENQASEEMYFIQSGMLEVFDTRRSLKIRLFEGDFFGEQAIINRNSKRKASIKSTVYSELLILSRKGLETIVLENEAFARRLFGYLKKKILNNFHNSPRKTSKWSLVYMINTAAINIKRMNPEITLESLLILKSSRHNPKSPLKRITTKDLDKINENETTPGFEDEEEKGDENKGKTIIKPRQFQENVYQTTSQLSELVRSAMKDKNAPRTSRQKSAQQEELNEIIEENDTNRKDNTVFQQKDNNNPYENYKFGNESPNRKSKFSSLKTLDERKLDPKFSKKIEG